MRELRVACSVLAGLCVCGGVCVCGCDWQGVIPLPGRRCPSEAVSAVWAELRMACLWAVSRAVVSAVVWFVCELRLADQILCVDIGRF